MKELIRTENELYRVLEKDEKLADKFMDDILEEFEYEHEAHYMLSEGGWECAFDALFSNIGFKDISKKLRTKYNLSLT